MASTQVSVDARFVRMRRRGFFTSSVSRGIARVGTSGRRDVGTSWREARSALEGDRRHRRRDPGASVGVRAGRREERRRVTSVDRGTNSMTDDVARALSRRSSPLARTSPRASASPPGETRDPTERDNDATESFSRATREVEKRERRDEMGVKEL